MAKALYFQSRGEWFKVNKKGQIGQKMNSLYDDSWKLLGVFILNKNYEVKIPFKELLKNPSYMIGGYVWDLNDDVKSVWNHIELRVTNAYVKEESK